MGIVKLIGNVHFNDKISVSVELDRFSPNVTKENGFLCDIAKLKLKTFFPSFTLNADCIKARDNTKNT